MIGNDKDFLTDPRLVQAEPAGPEHRRPDRLLDLARRRPPGLPELCSRTECDMALAGGVSINVRDARGYLYQDGMILSPDGHCRAFDAQAHGHGQRQGARRGGAQAARRCARRRRHDPCGDPGLGHQQRRLGEGRLHRAERRGAGAGDRRQPWRWRRPGRQHRLRRGARHGHPARRPDRDRGADAGVSRLGTDAQAASARSARSRPTSATSTRRRASPA